MTTPTARTGAIAAFVVAGVSLAAYPVLRPWGPETGIEGARDFASSAWPVAHLLGMVGFAALALALRSLSSAHPGPWSGWVRSTETLAWLASTFLLPFYGAEAFGLQAVGSYALDEHDAGALAIVGTFRNGPLALTTFVIGLVLLLGVGVRVARGLWSIGRMGRVGGLLTAAGLTTYLPQFFGGPALRIGHGIVLGVGLVLLGVAVSRGLQRHTTGFEGSVSPTGAAACAGTLPTPS